MESNEFIRIALIGKTGCGKSAVGNTLLGYKAFRSCPSGESVTKECQRESCELPTGETLVVIDTPGLMDTREENVNEEVTKAIAHLSPGPNAFLFVLEPSRATKEEVRSLLEMKNLFGEDSFLSFTIIVMVRKNEHTDKDDNAINVQEFINTMSCKEVQALHLQCGKRAVAVENKDPVAKKVEYRDEIIKMVKKMGGYYSHVYFQSVQQNRENNKMLKELVDNLNKERIRTKQLQEEIERKKLEAIEEERIRERQYEEKRKREAQYEEERKREAQNEEERRKRQIEEEERRKRQIDEEERRKTQYEDKRRSQEREKVLESRIQQIEIEFLREKIENANKSSCCIS